MTIRHVPFSDGLSKHVPRLLVKDIQKPVQEARSFWLQSWRGYHGMISRDKCNGDLVFIRSLYLCISASVCWDINQDVERTLGSNMPGVCTCTTFCTNLMQHILTPAGAVSHLLRMFILMAAIKFQVGISLGLAILGTQCNVRHNSCNA